MSIKFYTSIEQSHILTKFLPFESADMCYPLPYEEGDKPLLEQGGFGSTPCWSLAALLEQFEDTAGLAKDYGLWFCYDNKKSYCTKHYINPVDACYEMIIKLHEQKLL